MERENGSDAVRRTALSQKRETVFTPEILERKKKRVSNRSGTLKERKKDGSVFVVGP